MLSAREYVEIMTCQRLNKKLPTDLIISHQEFSQTKERLKNLIYKMSHTTNIPGFSHEDIEGFLVMKLHREMRRGQKFTNEFSYFAKSFENLIRDLNKDLDTAKKRLPSDPIDTAIFKPDIWPV